jgi:hypothetical protein
MKTGASERHPISELRHEMRPLRVSLVTVYAGLILSLSIGLLNPARASERPAYEVVIDENDYPQLRQVVSCAGYQQANEKTAILFTFGQSNGGNHGGAPFIARPGVANFDVRTGRCYRAQDPLIGATGLLGSPWSRLGDKLVGRGVYESILLVPISVGGSSVADWVPDGKLHPRLLAALDQLKSAGIEPTAFLWHQGEADSRLSYQPGKYTAAFRSIVGAIRARGFRADIYVAVATTCTSDTDYAPETSAQDIAVPDQWARLAEAQHAFREEVRQLPKVLPGTRLGPDTDAINPAWRWDDCHFGSEGQNAHAEAWFTVLTGKQWRTRTTDTALLLAVYAPDGHFERAEAVGRTNAEECAKWIDLSLARARQANMTIRAGVAYARSAEAAIVRPMCVAIGQLSSERVYEELKRQSFPDVLEGSYLR